MAELQSFLLFVRFEEQFEQSECIFLLRCSPFQEYDDATFHQIFTSDSRRSSSWDCWTR